jgi:hypothetical protein
MHAYILSFTWPTHSQLDERNFHCWGYRHHIAGLLKVEPSTNLTFSTQLVERNFSNYSAWNFRASELFKLNMVVPELGSVNETLLSELELVQNAFFTEPADQSAWMYFKWIVEALSPLEHVATDPAKELSAVQSSETGESNVSDGTDHEVVVSVSGVDSVPIDARLEMLESQLEVVGELLETDGDSKCKYL